MPNSKIQSCKLPLALAISAGLANVPAHAVYLNPLGEGEVLLYALYTVNEGKDTLLDITNTDDQPKAVKLRLREAMNSRPVLDLNVYLDKYDTWSAAITRTEDGARLITVDQTCTYPVVPEQGLPLSEAAYQGDAYHLGQGGPQGKDRTRVGFVEAIEMGVLLNSPTGITGPLSSFKPADWVRHGANGLPAYCRGIEIAWDLVWSEEATSQLNIAAPSGGLIGSATVIDVNAATAAAYNADALADWSAGQPLHTAPDSEGALLGDGNHQVVLPDGRQYTAANGWDAVSMVLQKNQLINTYNVLPVLGATTYWVVNFPTQWHYTNNYSPGSTEHQPLPGPFPTAWSDTLGYESTYWAVTGFSVPRRGSACMTPYVKAVSTNAQQSSAIDDYAAIEGFGGLLGPPKPYPEVILCWATNLLHISEWHITTPPSTYFDGYVQYNYLVGTENATGWLLLGFYQSLIALPNGTSSHGMPAIGASFITYSNNQTTTAGVTNNYGIALPHRGKGAEIVE